MVWFWFRTVDFKAMISSCLCLKDVSYSERDCFKSFSNLPNVSSFWFSRSLKLTTVEQKHKIFLIWCNTRSSSRSFQILISRNLHYLMYSSYIFFVKKILWNCKASNTCSLSNAQGLFGFIIGSECNRKSTISSNWSNGHGSINRTWYLKS